MIKYCTICKKLINNLFKTPIYNKKKYYCCSEKCYKTYLNEIWRNNNSQQENLKKPFYTPPADTYTKEQKEEFPDY